MEGFLAQPRYSGEGLGARLCWLPSEEWMRAGVGEGERRERRGKGERTGIGI